MEEVPFGSTLYDFGHTPSAQLSWERSCDMKISRKSQRAALLNGAIREGLNMEYMRMGFAGSI